MLSADNTKLPFQLNLVKNLPFLTGINYPWAFNCNKRSKTTWFSVTVALAFYVLCYGSVATSPVVLHWLCDSPRTGQQHFVAIGNPERHVRKASHRGSKQQ